VDVVLLNTPDGGELSVKNGIVELTDSIDTAVILSLFGGNDDDAGDDSTLARSWWGNTAITDLTRRQRSETQYLLRSLPLIPANLKRIEDAASRDLAWLTASRIATFVRTRATMPGLNRVKLEVFIPVDDRVYTFTFEQRDKPVLLLATGGGDAGTGSGTQMLDDGELMTDDGEPMTD
jgi:phage gp46-like protein